MPRPFRAALLLVLSGCASTPSAGPELREATGAAEMAIVGNASGASTVEQATITVRPGFVEVAVGAPPAPVWEALPAALLELGIPLSASDPQARVLTAQNQRVSRIGGRRLSTYFRCGGVYGDNADGGNTYVTMRVQVLPNASGEGSVVRTEVRAVASAPGSTTVGECGSNGTLEQLIARTVREKVAPPA